MTSYGMVKAASSGEGRAENDFYPTPAAVTRVLLPEIADFPHYIWEPACGDGAISKELIAGGHHVTSTDLIRRGYGTSGVDFLQTTELQAEAIVTNPPFGKLAPAFIKHALDLETPFIAILSNVNFWHAKKYSAMFERRRPSAILALTWRPDFTGGGSSYFNCIWTVWRPGAERTEYKLLPHPGPSIEDLL